MAAVAKPARDPEGRWQRRDLEVLAGIGAGAGRYIATVGFSPG